MNNRHQFKAIGAKLVYTQKSITNCVAKKAISKMLPRLLYVGPQAPFCQV